ncbi:hypothetical protein ABT160_28985 [Streptomyces sp. NPDC001941]|uniref:hypothetical protein n=1 Tax=Streptomyces sp. NPDC001941 TaxID=3154659 RepID=UPI00332E8957
MIRTRTISAFLAAGAATAALTLSGAATATAASTNDAPPSYSGPKIAVGAAVPASLSAKAAGCWYSGSHWWCNNRVGAAVYKPGVLEVVGRMYSNPSWFTCRSDNGGHVGGPHPNRWEWTQADNGAWGWMKDTDISSETDPLPVC